MSIIFLDMYKDNCFFIRFSKFLALVFYKIDNGSTFSVYQVICKENHS